MMKLMRKTSLVLLAVAVTAACEKNALMDLDEPVINGTGVKFFNFSVGGPAVNFFVNDTKMTAVNATGCQILDDTNRQECTTIGRESSSGVAFGGVALGGWYADVPVGQVTISGRIAAANDNPDKNLPIANLTTTVEKGKFYSFYLSGDYDATTKTTDSFIVEDNLPPVDYSVVHLRFVNASHTTNPLILYVTNRTTLETFEIGGAVPYKGASAFVEIPPGAYDLAAREPGSDTNVFTRANVTWNAGRAYTIAARGNTTTATGVFLDNTATR